MKKTELKQLLADEFQIQAELIRLCKEMLAEIFPDAPCLIYEFERDLEEGMEYNGCLQSLQYYRKQLNNNKQH